MFAAEGEKSIWSVGGGKGGVGKSVVAANMGVELAGRGRKVVLVDADLGGANLHTYFGIRHPSRTLDDFIKRRSEDLAGVGLETGVEGLRLICGGGEFLGVANPKHAQKEKLIRHITALDADCIVVDLGAGTTFNVLDFFAVSNRGVVVLVPEPAAIQNAYLFLKSFVYRRLSRLFSGDLEITEVIKRSTDLGSPECVKTFSDLCERLHRTDPGAAERALAEIKSFRPGVVLNMALTDEDLKVAEAFMSAAATFLSLDTEFVGALHSSPGVKSSARRMTPFMLDPSARGPRADMRGIVDRLLESSTGDARKPGRGHPPEARGGAEKFGFNDNFTHLGNVFHVQTEVTGGGAAHVDTVIYHGGRIFFSKKTMWEDVSEHASDIREFATRQHRAAIAAVKTNRIELKG